MIKNFCEPTNNTIKLVVVTQIKTAGNSWVVSIGSFAAWCFCALAQLVSSLLSIFGVLMRTLASIN